MFGLVILTNMKIVDLTLPMYTGMPVYPGDPEVSIELIKTLEKDGWNMRRIEMNTHDGTHVNVSVHGVKGGNTLDDYSLESFCGVAVVYAPDTPIVPDTGVIFRDRNIDENIAEQIKKVRPRFVGLSSSYEIDEEIERDFLKKDIILFERLANTELLPVRFMFYGVPLKIKGADGSPVRAFAVIE
ncbi:cyclase [bacterium]|nr:cyclase [bacterium]|tara:strand:- start:8710 stop:9264 length:555 start_codon:yes stop_codon:yes gene_type:complete